MGRISPDYYVQDGVVPRTQLPAVLRRIDELSRGRRAARRQRLPRRRRQPAPARPLRRPRRRARPSARERLAEQILEACIDAGGSITGEHGVGTDKACAMPLLFSEDDLAAMARLRRAFDPRRPRQPGQGLPDAAPVRRGARAPTARTRSSGPGSSSASERRRRARVRARRPDGASSTARSALDALQARARRARSAAVARSARDRRRSASACSRTSPARCATASARCATSCSA